MEKKEGRRRRVKKKKKTKSEEEEAEGKEGEEDEELSPSGALIELVASYVLVSMTHERILVEIPANEHKQRAESVFRSSMCDRFEAKMFAGRTTKREA